jgi:hypothetical protein
MGIFYVNCKIINIFILFFSDLVWGVPAGSLPVVSRGRLSRRSPAHSWRWLATARGSRRVAATAGGQRTLATRPVLRLPAESVQVNICIVYNVKKASDILVPSRTATKIPFMYSFSGNCSASVPIYISCVCERFLYSQDRPTYIQQQNRQIDRGNR